MGSSPLLIHSRSGEAAASSWQVSISPQDAGWGYSGLKVARLQPGSPLELATGEGEALVLPLAGGCRVTAGGRSWQLAGRSNVFSELTDYLYLPRGTVATLEWEGNAGAEGPAEIAVTTARAEADLPARYFRPDQVAASLRGAGNCTREVRNYALGNGVETDRLLVVEVITPAGNFSSYPPHKHDEHNEGERVLEEIYHYRFSPDTGSGFHNQYDSAPAAAANSAPPASPGQGSPEPSSPEPHASQAQATSAAGDSPELLVQVRHGDTVLVPRGFHGPCVALPGADMYYLNVMAGPARDGQWLMSDDPSYSLVRELWQGWSPDPRLPMAKEL